MAGSERAGAGDGLPLVAIIGRPNVGKSTLFNRIVGGRPAIVDNRPGVTRDRRYGTAEWSGSNFRLVDTGGFDLFTDEHMAVRIREQADVALEEADVVLFVVDAAAGVTPLDEELVRLLRSRGIERVLLLANKVDTRARESAAYDFCRFGFERIYPISAEHGLGLDEVLDDTIALFPQEGAVEEVAGGVKVALVGRPNVGKSSLVNAILGEERVIVDSTPGTTRDSIDSTFLRDGEEWSLIDTAGIRRRGKIGRSVEKFSVIRAIRSMERADVCVLVLDATEMITDQDAHIGGEITKAEKGCVVVVNKWDLIKMGPRAGDEYMLKVKDGLRHLSWAEVIFTSALSSRGIGKLLDAVGRSYGEYSRSLTTPELNELLRRVVNAYKPATSKGKKVALGYITQECTRPPTFAVLVNEAERIHFSYRRYLENRIREKFGFRGTSLALRFKTKVRRPSDGGTS